MANELSANPTTMNFAAVAEPRHYHTVSASVTAGELSADPWHEDMGGLRRSFSASGDGHYDLRARLLAGQLTIRSE